MMRVLDLFSGIGGFSLGLERAGMETVAFCEVDKEKQTVLRKRFPAVEIHEDIRSLNYDGHIDLICGGYPCQPFSVAGKQKGSKDKRHLWPEMLKQIRKHRPAWVIGENVKGHINKGLDRVLSDLEDLGYSTRAFCISAKAIGANHGRERVWIVAHSSSDGRYESTLTRGDGETDEHIPQRQDEDSHYEGRSSLRSLLEGTGYSPWGWGAKPPEIRVDDGLPNRMDRNRMMGEAVIPQIPQIIGGIIYDL